MVELSNIHFSYGRKNVFSGLNLQLDEGHVYGLLGKNGVGKSTLLYLIMGLLHPAKGSLKVRGFNPGERDIRFLQQVFLVPEEFYLPNIHISVFAKYNSPLYPLFNMAQFETYVTQFEIPDDQLGNMSYAQKKKALISFGLATNVPLLLMDEPTNGLDINSKNQLKKIIFSAWEKDRSIVISTHQLVELEKMFDHVAIINGGKECFNQSVEAITNKLTFKSSLDKTESLEAIYNEPSLRGYNIVIPNTEAHESKIDLEILYKAFLSDPAKINSLFKD